MSHQNLRQRIIIILAISALGSLLCTLITGFALSAWRRSNALEKIVSQAKAIGTSEVPKFVSGLLLSDEVGGLEILTKRLQERGNFDIVKIVQHWDQEAAKLPAGYSCSMTENEATCVNKWKVSYVLAEAVAIPNRTLGWLVIEGHDKEAGDLLKTLLPFVILFFGFVISVFISGIWIWRYIAHVVQGALVMLSETVAPALESSVDQDTRFSN